MDTMYLFRQRQIDVGTFATKHFSSKIWWKIACFLGPRFWQDFGRVLGGVWEAQILDFRIFFDVFSKQILKELILNCYVEQNAEQDAESALWKLGSGHPQAGGKRFRDGYKDIQA